MRDKPHQGCLNNSSVWRARDWRSNARFSPVLFTSTDIANEFTTKKLAGVYKL